MTTRMYEITCCGKCPDFGYTEERGGFCRNTQNSVDRRSISGDCPLPKNPVLQTHVSIAGGFVYGDYEQIKAVQQAIFDSEELAEIKQKQKSALKPVDLSVLIKSGIDCEFSDAGFKGECDRYPVGPLTHITEGTPNKYWINAGCFFTSCRPRKNHWHNWQGGECPLPEGLLVEVRRRDGSLYSSNTVKNVGLRWLGKKDVISQYDIIAFHVIGLADGYCWPWQK